MECIRLGVYFCFGRIFFFGAESPAERKKNPLAVSEARFFLGGELLNKRITQARMDQVTADSVSLYAFGLRSTQAVFVQEALSIVIEPAFALLMSWLELPDDTRAVRSHVSMYRITRALFRFVASLLILRFCGIVAMP